MHSKYSRPGSWGQAFFAAPSTREGTALHPPLAQTGAFALGFSVSGLFGGHIGQAKRNFYSLVKASDSSVDRNLFEVKIDVSQSDYALTWIHDEDELQKLLDRTEEVRMHHRIKIPRIVAAGVYWPPRARVQKRINELMRAFEAGEIPDPRPFNFQEMEGNSIRTAFEPIWEGYHFNFDETKE